MSLDGEVICAWRDTISEGQNYRSAATLESDSGCPAKVNKEDSKDPIDPRSGAFIVAPCPHDGRCPLEKSGKYCHFVQRLQRTTSQQDLVDVEETPDIIPYVEVNTIAFDSDAMETDNIIDSEEDPEEETVDANLRGGWGRIVFPPVRRGRQFLGDENSSVLLRTLPFVSRQKRSKIFPHPQIFYPSVQSLGTRNEEAVLIILENKVE
ncbi:hypothetical protein F3Y22_tig00110338pilonHSYRG00066 [Hibiscus syriacus]|uniref:Uncharacterized protein n=1 Tax=Hibiscus syriacus TaxID=106335 RepID=A0A6A3AXF7_HIBSY|nr:hypothetical protein F3Y22_tig00110338pilonHSYRG00066 [Hibiscus syriacus]